MRLTALRYKGKIGFLTDRLQPLSNAQSCEAPDGPEQLCNSSVGEAGLGCVGEAA